MDVIRRAEASDSPATLGIYAPYVEKTAVSFETQIPTEADFARRISDIGEVYPYLVYFSDEEIIGYAYASKHRERAAYCYDADLSIYVQPDFHGKGVAQKLYGCLFEILRELGYYSAYAGCTVPNPKSINFHEKMGFSYVGTYHGVGYKLGEWHDVAWFEKALAARPQKPGVTIKMSELPMERLEKIVGLYI